MAGSVNRHTPGPSGRGWLMRLLPDDIRARVFFVVLVMLLPLSLLVVGSSVVRYFTGGALALRETQETARVVAAAFTASVQDLRHQEAIIGTAIGTRGQPNWGWTNALLTTSTNQNPSLHTMSWVSPEGRILASSAAAAIGRDIRSSQPVGSLLAGGDWVLSDVLPTGPITQTVTMVAASATRVDGQLRGLIVAEINPENLGDALLRSGVAHGGVTAVFDRQGRLVFSRPPRAGTFDERAAWRESDPLLRNALGAGRETRGVVTPAAFESPQYVAYVPIADTGYVAGVARSRADALAPFRRSLLLMLLLFLLIAAATGVFAYLTSNTIVDPLRTLQRDTERLGRREPVPPSAGWAPREVRTLHSAVTDMAALLLHRLDTTETERDRLQTIFDFLPISVRFVDANGDVLLANPAARALLGEDALGMASTPRGRYLWHRLDGSPLPLAEVPLVRALHEGEASRNAEFILQYEHGDGILALVSATPVHDASGALSGVVEVALEVVSDVTALQNITVSTNLEQQLASVHDQLDTLLDILPVGVFLLDAQGRILQANAESSCLWGGVIPTVNAIGDFRFFRGWWTRTGEAVRAEEWPPVRALTRNETVVHAAITLNRFDGLRGDVLTSAAPLHDTQGAITGAVWVLQDSARPK